MNENEKDQKIKALEEKVPRWWLRQMGNYSTINDGEREVIILQNCCPFHRCAECEFRTKLVGAIKKAFKENPKWWKVK